MFVFIIISGYYYEIFARFAYRPYWGITSWALQHGPILYRLDNVNKLSFFPLSWQCDFSKKIFSRQNDGPCGKKWYVKLGWHKTFRSVMQDVIFITQTVYIGGTGMKLISQKYSKRKKNRNNVNPLLVCRKKKLAFL